MTTIAGAGIPPTAVLVELSAADLDAFERGFTKEIELVRAAKKKGEEATTPQERGKAAQEEWEDHTAPLAAQAIGMEPGALPRHPRQR